MLLVKPSFRILTPLGDDRIKEILQYLEFHARNCYQSQDKIYWNSYTDNSCIPLLNKIIKNKHFSILEHALLSVQFIADRRFLAEITRQRLCSFAVESSRFCRYDSNVTFIIPTNLPNIPEGVYHAGHYDKSQYTNEEIDFIEDMIYFENAYIKRLNLGWTPQLASVVLPGGLKTTINMTANLRQMRYILQLRTTNKCHPSMLELTIPLLNDLKEKIPVIFKDITY